MKLLPFWPELPNYYLCTNHFDHLFYLLLWDGWIVEKNTYATNWEEKV